MLAPGPGGNVKPVEAGPAPAPAGPPPGEGWRWPARWRAGLARQARRPHFWAALVVLGVLVVAFILVFPHLWAWYHFRAARSALEQFHNPQAIRHLLACREVWPNNPDVQLMAARAARRARTYRDAEILLDNYRRVRGLDEALSFEQLLLSAERNVDSVAEVCRRHVEENHPEAVLILEALTRGFLRQYQLGPARFCLGEWLKRQPDNPQALCLQGEIHLDYEHSQVGALASYRRAVELDPDHEEARLGLAIVLLQCQTFAEAAGHLEYLRKCQPDNLHIQVGLAECRRGLGKGAEALRLVESVLARRPEYPQALALRGQLALDQGQFAAAEDYLRRAVELNPRDQRTRYNLILCLNRNGKFAEARRHKRKHKRMEEDLKQFHTIVTRDLARRPHDPALHYTLGRLLLRSGHRGEARRWLQSALRLDPQYAPARQALAEYYQKAEAKPERPE